MNEQQFKKLITAMVNESLKTIYENYYFEGDSADHYDDDDDDEDKKDKKNGKKSKHRKERNHEKDNDKDETRESERSRRRRIQIEEFLTQPGVNTAQYFYKLFGVKPVEGDDNNDMKNARSLGEKKLHHEENSEGYEYYFTSEEVNSLFSMISGNELS